MVRFRFVRKDVSDEVHRVAGEYVFTLHTGPTPIQQRAFELLALNPDRTQ